MHTAKPGSGLVSCMTSELDSDFVVFDVIRIRKALVYLNVCRYSARRLMDGTTQNDAT